MKKAYAVLVPATYANEPARPTILWFDVLADSEDQARTVALVEFANRRDWYRLFRLGQLVDFMVWPADELQACVRALEWMNEKQICPSS